MRLNYTEYYHNELGTVVVESQGGETTFTQYKDERQAREAFMFAVYRKQGRYQEFFDRLKLYRRLGSCAKYCIEWLRN